MATSPEVPWRWPVAINGRPYQIDPSGYRRESIPVLRQQSDQTVELGEQSLNARGLWRRSQDSWHHGAGQDFFDGKVGGTVADSERFDRSLGADVWTKGEVSTLPSVDLIRSGTYVVAVGNHAYVVDGTEVWFAVDPSGSGTIWTAASIQAGEAAQTVRSLTTDGRNIWAALGTSGIHRTTRGVGASTANVPAAPGGGNISLVAKALDRLLAAGSRISTTQKNVLWEVVAPLGATPALGTGTVGMEYVHPNTSFVWEGVSPGRNCAPGDQMVETVNRGKVRIDELQPGVDGLACYWPKHNRVLWGLGRRGYGFRRAVRSFTGDLVVMTTDETRVRVTPNHWVPARWKPESATAHVVYLMRKGDWWRIGKVNLFDQFRFKAQRFFSFGPGGRCRTEQADALWILGIYESQVEALVAERYLSALYGLTGAVFRNSNSNRCAVTTDEMLKDLHTRLAERGSGERARRLLADLGLEVDFPFWESSNAKQHGHRTHMRLVACNLLSGWMEVPLDTRTKHARWAPVTMTREPVVEMPVYSLEVEQYHTYIGDGQCLFNCLYAFGNVPAGPIYLNLGFEYGGKAEIYRITANPTDGALTAPTIATYLPDGESIHALVFYAGGIIMGTSRGVRVGIADAVGNIDYGPLIETYYPVCALEPQDRWCFFGISDMKNTYVSGIKRGLGRLDLGYFTDTLTPAWAQDLEYPTNDIYNVTSIASLSGTGVSSFDLKNLIWAVDAGAFSSDPRGVYRVDTLADGDSAWADMHLQTGRISFSTAEPKTLRSFEVRHSPLFTGSFINLYMRKNDGAWDQVTNSTTTGASTTFAIGAGVEAGDELGVEVVEFELWVVNRSPTTPVRVTRWTLKALPTPGRDETFTLPLMLYPVVDSNLGEGDSVTVDISDEIEYLKGLERAGTIVEFQVANEVLTGYIEDSSFTGEYMAHQGDGTVEERNVAGVYTVRVSTLT